MAGKNFAKTNRSIALSLSVCLCEREDVVSSAWSVRLWAPSTNYAKSSYVHITLLASSSV